MVRRPCLDCGTLTNGTTRCDPCTRATRRARGSATARGYNAAWARHAKATIAAHRRRHGDTCPGWDRPAHPIAPADWVCDHDIGPLCRSCNGTKAATLDRARASSRSSRAD
jgi:5-methylcytosine-specific restriction protein A